LYEELYIRTQYDDKDLMSVEEIFYFDENDDERQCTVATNACIDIVTCADQGTDLWRWLREQVEHRLQEAGISFVYLHFEDERGN
jgi:hypothetical protein